METKSVLVVVAALLVGTFSTSVNACTHGDIRLAGYYRTNPDLEGSVEVCRYGSWGAVCDDYWHNIDASVACRQLGHSYEGAIAKYYSTYGSPSVSFKFTYVGCTGSESRLIDCYYRTPSTYYYSSYYCSSSEGAGVVCQSSETNNTVLERNITDNDTDIDGIRLINKDNVNNTNMGRLEVNYGGTWGTVCNDFWSYSDAKVACRMLGFEDVACAVTSNQFGIASNSTPYWMSNLQCTGSEDYLDSCDFGGWGSVSGCSHTSFDDAGVVCINAQKIGTPYNIQLINSSTSSFAIKWNVPGLPSDTQNATLRYYITFENVETGSYYMYILIGTSLQEGDEVAKSFTGLTINTEYIIKIRAEILYTPCSYTYASGNYSEPMVFRTNATFKQSTIPIRLISPYPGVDFLGRVEVFYNNQWGTVCDDLFSLVDGDIVCRMLNFTKGALCESGYYATYGRGTGPIWLDNLNCDASDEVLEDCTHNGWGVHNCQHYDDVGVLCEPTLPQVKNLQVTSVSHTSISLSWSAHSFPRGVSTSQFEILYKTGGVSYTARITSSTLTQYTLRNLQFEQNYQITIRARMRYSTYCYSYFYGEYSNEVNITTMETAPDGPPTSFTLEVINSTAIEAMWNLPGIYNRNGIIRGYKLLVLRGGVEIRNINITGNDTLAFIVGGLQPATAYTFSVLAYTVADGPKSIHLTTDTLLHDPFITGFGIYGSGVDKVTRYTYNYGFQVHCTTSNDPSISSTNWYFSNGTKVGLVDEHFREGYYPHNKTTVLQIGLNRRLSTCDGGNYTCVVRSNSTRTERRSFYLVIGSSPTAPSRPTAVRIKSTSITIAWSQSACNGGHLPSSFKIRYRRTSSSSYYSYSYITVSNATQRQYTITGLSTSTSYDFSVLTTTVDSTISSYSTVATIVTLPPAPSVPRDVTVKLVRPLVAEVSWRAPSVSNGVITHYTIYAIPQVSFEIGFRTKRQTTSLPQTVKKVLPGTHRSGNISLPAQSVTYQFRVSASSSSGVTANEGEMSSVSPNATIFVPEQGLPTPRNLRIGRSTNTSVTLMWDYPPPPVETIESFFVTYSSDVEWRSPAGTLVQFEDSGELTVTGTTVTVSPLIPGTSYHFKVSVVTSKGRGAEESVFASTQVYQDKLAYFQLRLSPVYSCLEYSNPSLNFINTFRTALVEEINSYVCTECELEEDNIRNHEFSCRGGLTNQIVYRSMIIGTDMYSAPALVSRIQSWVATGSASITVLSTRLHLDKSCNASLDTLAEPDCFEVVETVTTTTKAIPTTSKATVTMKTTTPKTEEKGPSVKPVVAEQVRVGDIFGFLFGVIIIALLVVLIIVIIVIAVKKLRPKRIKSVTHDRMFDASFSDIGSNRESIHLDDDKKEDLAK